MILLLIILLPLGLAPLVYLLRRFSTPAALLSAGTSLGVAIFTFALAPDQRMEVLGRGLVFDHWRRILLVFIFAVAAFLFLYAWRITQGWSFFPFGLVSLGLLGAAIMVEEFLIAAIFLEIAGLVLLFLLQGGILAEPRVILTYLAALVLAAPTLLFASYLCQQVALHPDRPFLVQLAAVALSLGFGILLGAIPLHLYLPALAREAPPLVFAFLLVIYQTVALALLMSLFPRYPWLVTDAGAFSLILKGGFLTALVGGLLAILQREPGPLLAYGAISGLGVVLMGLGVASPWGASASVIHLLSRSLATLLVTMGWGVIQERHGRPSSLPSGVVHSLPWATLGYVGGGLTLAGFPLLGGFAARWYLYGGLLGLPPLYTAGLIAASLSVAWSYLRPLGSMMKKEERWEGKREPLVVVVMLLALLGASLLLGVYPQPLFESVHRLMEAIPPL